MDDENEDSTLNSELNFLIALYLRKGPFQKTAEAFQEELQENGLLPKKYDFVGDQHSQTIDELVKKYPHITGNTLLNMCKNLRDILIEANPPGVLKTSSILGTGTYGPLRNKGQPQPVPLSRVLAKRRGYLLSDPAGKRLPRHLAHVLEARKMSGAFPRNRYIWPKLYNRIQLLNKTLGHISAVYCVLFDQSGQFIFTGADDLLVKVWSTISGRLLATLRGASAEITDLAVNVENTLIAAGSLDRVIYVWCLQTTTLVAQLTAPVGLITGVSFCPTQCGDYRYLASTSTDGSVAFWMYMHTSIGKNTVFLCNPVLFNEKMRPGVAQMICSAFSPGGTFLAAGNSDHHVRVYYVPGDEGPQRIMEEAAHTDRVDSIQWANRNLRFVSGSKDGSAFVWRYRQQKWNRIRLDITEEITGLDETTRPDSHRQKPKVFMVSWDLSDQWIVTAVHDASLKVWDSETGKLVHVLKNHRRDVFVLEPHPLDIGIMLSAGHDGLLCVWDIVSGNCLYQYQNLIDGHGHGSFYDARWSPDGTLIATTDSHGHILLFGLGSANHLLKEIPTELFFSTDYLPIERNECGTLLDEATRQPLHLLDAPYLVNVDGVPYKPQYQKLVPGRESEESAASNEEVSRIRQVFPGQASVHGGDNVPIRSDLVSTNPANPWLTRMLLPILKASTLKEIRDKIDAISLEERIEYEREKRRAPEILQLPLVLAKKKQRKKQANRPQIYQTRAAADESEFLNPDSLDLSLSSTSEDSAESIIDSDDSSSSVYSDWIADHGVSLEPPKRSRRRRAPARRLSISPPPLRRRNKEVKEERGEENSDNDDEADKIEKPLNSDNSSPPKLTTSSFKLEDLPNEYLPPKWLSEIVPRKAPYYPQMGDEVMFFQEGYKLYLKAVIDKKVYVPSTRDSSSKLGLTDPIFVKVIGIKYEIRPPRLCCLRLAVLDDGGALTSQFFNIKYHDVPDVIDFIILKQTYDIAMQRQWKPGDRFRCMIDDSWWQGNIVAFAKESGDYPNSPFLSLLTEWDNGESEPMSPWDLEPEDLSRQPVEPGGSMDVLPEEMLALIYIPRVGEWPGGNRDSICERIAAAFEQVMTLAVAEAFSAPVDLALYPAYALSVEYPVDLSLIKGRLDNRFYRRLTALQYDIRYLATNAEKFNNAHSQIVKEARIVTDLCLKVVKDPNVDVLSLYRQLVDCYHSDTDDEADNSMSRPSTSLRYEHVESSGNQGNEVWLNDCERLLRELYDSPDAAPFREPVDLIEFPDYLQVVETPMDFGTIRQELTAGKYNSPKELFQDVRLIFMNSKTYNTNKRSRIFAMSVRLSNLFEARMKQLTVQWKKSRRLRIRELAKSRKLRIRLKLCYAEPNEDPLQTNDDDEPKPSTSTAIVQPLRLPLERMMTCVSRGASTSEDDTDLSTLRNNYRRKSECDDSDDENYRLGGDSTIAVPNGSNHSEHSEEDTVKLSTLQDNLCRNGNQSNANDEESGEEDGLLLSTLKRNMHMKRPTSEVNGHSYAKPSSEENTNDSHDQPSVPVQNGVSEHSEDDDSDKTDVNNDANSQRPNETSSESEQHEEESDWNNEGSTTSTASRSSSNQSQKRRSARNKERPIIRTRSVNRGSNSRETRRTTRRRPLNSSFESDGSGGSSGSSAWRPTRNSGRRKRPQRNRRRHSDSSESSMSEPHRRKRLRKRDTSESSSDSDATLPDTQVSSRGRVRKMTERAKAAFRRKD